MYQYVTASVTVETAGHGESGFDDHTVFNFK
jgi:hypothetical protein